MLAGTTTPELNIVAIGAFGHAVATRLMERFTDSTVQGEPPELDGTDPRPVVLAVWREARQVARAIDASKTIPWWVPVTFAHPVIRVGPILSHDVPGCYRCLSDRALGGADKPDYTVALWERYDRDPTIGPLGYLEHHVSVATALATMLIHHRDGARRRLCDYDTLTGALQSHALVPFHDCPRWSDETSDESLSKLGGGA